MFKARITEERGGMHVVLLVDDASIELLVIDHVSSI